MKHLWSYSQLLVIIRNNFVSRAGRAQGSLFFHSLPLLLFCISSVSFTITASCQLNGPNDDICSPIDLGIIPNGGIVGDMNSGIYHNLSATNSNEPNPFDDGAFWNDAGVWFTFTTGSDPDGMIILDVFNDPEGTGEEIDLQVAVYIPDDNSCTGNMSLRWNVSDNNSFDGQIRMVCPNPNTTFFILVDGGTATPGTDRGYFGLQLRGIDVIEAPDERCDAEDLGVIPAGGSVSTNGFRANFCGTSIGDPNVSAFIVQHSVWFEFVPPPSGHILIEGISDTTIEDIGVQLALFRSFNNTCSSFFFPVGSVFTAQDKDEIWEVSCLFPERTYWLLIDGSGSDARGIFTLSISDAGDITPVTTVDTTLCAGQSLIVGTSIYSTSGIYADTLQLFAGCDSIVNTNLVVLDQLQATVTQLMPAIGLGNPNAVAEVTATGGSGNYTFEWCNGETGMQATALVGGDFCCVTVTDDNACKLIECFTVDFITDIIPSFENDTLACNGDSDGAIVFSAVNGQPPYNYFWQNTDNSLNGTGAINTAGQEVNIENLPAGEYTFTITDPFDDTTFVAIVTEPAAVIISILEIGDASCFGFCDGMLEIGVEGGTGSYQLQWSGGLDGQSIQGQLCAGTYTVTATDENNCVGETLAIVGEPEQFIATALTINDVSCFEGSDGQASVNTNGNPVQYNWNNGDTNQTAANLPAGFYSVTVTNEDGCEDVGEAQISQPDEAVQVSISIERAISCKGEADGIILAGVSGPGNSFSYAWSNGAVQEIAMNIVAGMYFVTVVNDAGCEAFDSMLVNEPPEIVAEVSAKDITCLDPPNGGSILIDNVSGGTPAYQFSLDGIIFSPSLSFVNLFEGQYGVIIRDAAACEKVYSLEVLGPPELDVSLGPDLSIQQGDSIMLTALANSEHVSYSWKPSDSLDATDAPSVMVRPVGSTGYQVVVTDSLTFCTASDFIFVSVRKDRKIYIPNVFSPNLDGTNDIFMVFGGLGVVEVESFRVFDRSGSMVYEALNFRPNDPNYGWDGTFKGRKLNTGVFVYVAEIAFVDGLVEVFKGDVVLMR